MTITVSIAITTPAGGQNEHVTVTDAAEEAIRFAFNPSGRPRVHRLKALAAAFITECDAVAAELPDAGRELAVAKTNMQTASMWSVLGATKGA